MESGTDDPPPAEEDFKQAQAVLYTAIEDHHDQTGGASSTSQSQAAARSYECTFCKRGFSNAQALGGHMNIHRKDKAKLKHQYSSSSASSTNVESTSPPQHRHTIAQMPILDLTKSSELDISSSTQNWPRIFFPEGQPRQLPLFAETTTTTATATILSSRNDINQEPIIMEEDDVDAELDLELRLGHDPPPSSPTQEYSSSSPTGMKKFL